MASKEDKSGKETGEADSTAEEHRSTATSAATADPAKQALIRRHREEIAAAQAKIRELTGGRESRAGSHASAATPGFSHQVRTKIVVDKIEQTLSPTVNVTPDGNVQQMDPPVPMPSITGETTDTATGTGTSSGTGGASSDPMKKKSALTEASYGTPADQRYPGENESLAIRLILQDSNGQRARIHVSPDVNPRLGTVISIANALAPGVDFRGKVTEMSGLLIVPDNKMTDLRRSDRTKRKHDEIAAARQATEKYKDMGEKDGGEYILDISVPKGDDPPPPVEEESAGDLVIDDPQVPGQAGQASDPSKKTDPAQRAEDEAAGAKKEAAAAAKTAEEAPAAAKTAEEAAAADKTAEEPAAADKTAEELKEKDGPERPKDDEESEGRGEKPKEPKPSTSKDAGFQQEKDDNDEDFVVEDLSERAARAQRRGKTSLQHAMSTRGKKQPAAAEGYSTDLEVAAWLRNVEDLHSPPKDEPAPLKEVMGLSGKVIY